MKFAFGLLLAAGLVVIAVQSQRSAAPASEGVSAIVPEASARPASRSALSKGASTGLAAVETSVRREAAQENTEENTEEKAPGATYFVEARASWYGGSKPAIGGLEVEVFLDGQRDVVLFRGTTPGDGRLAVHFDLDDGALGPSIPAAALRGVVVSPGYMGLVGRISSRSEADAKNVIRVTARPGSTVMGRVVDRKGQPVASASVSGRHWVTGDGPRRLEHHGHSQDLGDGHFALHLPNARTDFIVADSERGGLAVHSVQERGPSDPWPALTLTLKNGGAVRGRLLDETGEPVVNKQLLVCRAELDDGQGRLPLPEPAASKSLVHGGGMPWRKVITNKEGVFRANGLRGGRYVVRAGRTLLTPQPVLADGNQISLTLKRPCLVVHLLGSSGAPWSGEPVRVDRGGDSLGPERWPGVPHLRVTPSVAASGGHIESGTAVPFHSKTTDSVVYELPRGGGYWVTAYGGPFDGEPRHVVIDPDGGRQDIVLQAGAAVELAKLTVNLTWDPGLKEPTYHLYLERIDTGVIVQLREPYFGGPHQPFEVPPGNYRVVAEGKPNRDTYHGGIFASRELGRVEATIELRPGDVRDMDLSLTVGGRLEVTVNGTPLPEDKAQVIADHPRWPNAEADAYLNWQGESALLTIERPGRRGEKLFHLDSFVKWEKPSLAAHWRMGETHTSEILPVGRYELVARAPGGRVARIPVEITAGVTAPVEISLGSASGR